MGSALDAGLTDGAARTGVEFGAGTGGAWQGDAVLGPGLGSVEGDPFRGAIGVDIVDVAIGETAI